MFLSLSIFLLSFAWYEEERDLNVKARTVSELPITRSMLNMSFSLSVLRKGVSMVVACQNKHEALRSTIPSWLAVESVDEIVIVDWSSTVPLRFVVEEIDSLRKQHPPLHVVEVRNQSKWEASRAFNVGFRAAHFSQVLKVDCDHKVRVDFVANHAMPQEAFFAGSRHLERASFDENLRGTLFIEKRHFFRCGGYDERMGEYGGEQEDLLMRLEKSKLKRIDIDYNTLLQTWHEKAGMEGANNEPERHYANMSKEIEAMVNLKLLTKFPPWNSYMGWKSFSKNMDILHMENDTMKSHTHVDVEYRLIRTRNEIVSIRQLSNSSDVEEARGAVVSHKLLDFELPMGVTNALPLKSRLQLLKRLESERGGSATNQKPRTLFVHCVGNVLHRMLCLASGVAYAEQSGITPIVIWANEANMSSTPLNRLLSLTNSTFIHTEELLDDWEPSSYFSDAVKKSSSAFIFKDLSTPDGNNTRFDGDNIGARRHVYVRVRGALASATTRLTSEEAMRRQLIRLEVKEGMQGDLQMLRDRGLCEAIGVYVRGEKGESGRMKEELKGLLNGIEGFDGMGRKVFYVDEGAKEGAREVIRGFGEVLMAPRGGAECAEEWCEENVVLRLFAMKEVSRFWVVGGGDKEVERDGGAFVPLVRILRGEAFNW